MELVPCTASSEIEKTGREILQNNAFIRDFLQVFGNEKAQNFIKRHVRTEMEWKSVLVFLRLYARIQAKKHEQLTSKSLAFYLHAMMSQPKMLREVVHTLQEKPRKKNTGKRLLLCAS